MNWCTLQPQSPYGAELPADFPEKKSRKDPQPEHTAKLHYETPGLKTYHAREMS